MATKPSALRRQTLRYACHIFSTREEERLWLEMTGARTISYLRMADLELFYDLIMRH
jgi:hypothetical protein